MGNIICVEFFYLDEFMGVVKKREFKRGGWGRKKDDIFFDNGEYVLKWCLIFDEGEVFLS